MSTYTKVILGAKQRSQQMYQNHALANEDRDFVVTNGSSNIFSRKRKRKHIYPNNPHDIITYKYQGNVTKLAFLILTYLYTQDDNVITRKENRSINKILKQREPFLEMSDYDVVLKFVDDLPTLPYIMSYMERIDVKETLFNDAITIVRKIIKGKSLYIDFLDSLEKKYRATL